MASFSKPPLSYLSNPKSRKPLIVLLAAILLLRSRLLSLPSGALKRIPVVLRKGHLSQEELNEILQRVYETEEDGSKTVLVPYRNQVTKVRAYVL